MAWSSSILFVDAYDSFSQNIAAILHQELSAKVTIIKIDTNVQNEFGCTLQSFIQKFDAVVLGPGPGDPRHGTKDTGIFAEILDLSCAASAHIPILGICLGFQVLCLKNGLQLQMLSMPCHGHSKQILPVKKHQIFDGLDTDSIFATCYNSLGIVSIQSSREVDLSRPGSSSTNASFGSTTSSVPNFGSMLEDIGLDVLAMDQDGYIMAVAHKSLPFFGVQFHPESCKSNISCRMLLKNWFQHVVKHYKRKQAVHPEIPLAPELSPHADCTVTSNPAYTANISAMRSEADRAQILQLLLQATQTSTDVVTYRKRKTELSRKAISCIAQNFGHDHGLMMLESTKKGRFSIYALLGTKVKSSNDANNVADTPLVTYKNGKCNVKFKGIVSCSISESVEIKTAPQELIGAIEDLLTSKQATAGCDDIPFWGGFMGYMSYELGLDSMGVTSSMNSSRCADDLRLLWVERSLVYDSLTSTICVQSIREGDGGFIISVMEELQNCEKQFQCFSTHRSKHLLHQALSQARIQLPNQQQYDAAYDHCQDNLRAGNSYELCLTAEAIISLPPLDRNLVFQLYHNIHSHNPVPYGALMDFSDLTILSTSPEQFMSWNRNGEISMMPMKGTVKRSPSMTFARATEILSSPKESAENLMIADLIRHDLYTAVGYTSKVEVVKLCEVIEHETVYQLVSHIRAEPPISQLNPEPVQPKLAMKYGIKALFTSLPPGSMTGAPKKRSCEILGDLEKRNRGVYSGIMGYFDVGGGGAWNVAIRTAYRVKDDTTNMEKWHVGAGGAITVLSTKQGEWGEMQTKLNSVLQGFTIVSDEF